MDYRDQSVLLSLMETGIVSELKTGRTEEIRLNTRVYAACNDVTELAEELRSRFIVFRIREYSAMDYKRVVFRVLTERERINESIARYIANRLVKMTRDVRCAVHVSRLMTKPTKREADRVIKILKSYDSFLV